MSELVRSAHRAAYRMAARVLRIWARLFHPTLHGAAVVVRSGEHVLTVRTSYQSWLTVPGGRVGRGEPALDAARRELHEEAGLEAPKGALRPLGEIVLDHSNIEDHVAFFEWRVDGPRPAAHVDGREIVESRWQTEAEILAQKLWPPLRVLLEGRPAPPSSPGAAGAAPTGETRR